MWWSNFRCCQLLGSNYETKHQNIQTGMDFINPLTLCTNLLHSVPRINTSGCAKACNRAQNESRPTFKLNEIQPWGWFHKNIKIGFETPKFFGVYHFGVFFSCPILLFTLTLWKALPLLGTHVISWPGTSIAITPP